MLDKEVTSLQIVDLLRSESRGDPTALSEGKALKSVRDSLELHGCQNGTPMRYYDARRRKFGVSRHSVASSAKGNQRPRLELRFGVA